MATSMNITNRRFVITGGPGAGKTTVLNTLAARGYRYVPDAARIIIQKRLASGLSPRPPLDQFGRDILRMDINGYRETPVTDDPVFFDRGIVDALGILNQQDAISLADTEAYIKAFPYHPVVLVMPPWRDIYKNDAERDQTFSESVQVYEHVNRWYAQWGYETVEVPCTGIEQRADLILKTVRFALTNWK